MYKKLIITLLFLLTLSFSADAQKECEKFTADRLGVSFCLPAGWNIKEDPQQGRIIVAKPVGDKVPNIMVNGADHPGTVPEAADLLIEHVLKLRPNGAQFEMVSKKPFAAGKAQGVKVVYRLEKSEDNIVKTIQYVFSGKGDIKIIVNATLPWSGSQEMEEAVDDALKTFELRN